LEGSQREAHHRYREQSSLVGGAEKKPLVSGVARINTVQEDSIVYPTPLRLIVDLGARSLVSGVDCNDSKNSPKLELLVIFFFTSSRRHASSPCAFFYNKNYFANILF
jgi:hypothetical protein